MSDSLIKVLNNSDNLVYVPSGEFLVVVGVGTAEVPLLIYSNPDYYYYCTLFGSFGVAPIYPQPPTHTRRQSVEEERCGRNEDEEEMEMIPNAKFWAKFSEYSKLLHN